MCELASIPVPMKLFSSVLLLVLVQQCVRVCNGLSNITNNTTNTTDDG